MDEKAFIEKDILGYLEAHQKKELLRFTTVGSVDDGKSTLIGRLLYDAKGLYEDQLKAVQRASSQKSDDIDLSLVTDGLKAEREQGITIDVAYRYFSTDKRKFIIADTPGHVQYTRNMATGASTANVAIVLIDARLGVLQQSRRHAYIASLLGIPHLAVCVNKMDLKDYDHGVFDAITAVFSEFAAKLTFKDITFIPISALKGDNIVKRSDTMPWFTGPTLLEHLESVPVARDQNLTNFRFPVQYVLRPNLDYRGFSGDVASGVVKKGDPILVLPSRKTTRVKAVDVYSGELDEAFAPMSVTLRLEDEIDISRGDMLVHPNDVPTVSQSFEAIVVWMNEKPLDLQKSYLLKHTTQVVRTEIEAVSSHTNLETLGEVPADGLSLNDIGRVRFRCHKPLFFDPYISNRATGAFILIDSLSNNTVAAGMIVGTDPSRGSRLTADGQPHSQVSPAERRERLGQGGALVWLTGASEKERLTVGYATERVLFDRGRVSLVLSSADFAGSASDRLAALVTAAEKAVASGLIVIVLDESRPDRAALASHMPQATVVTVGTGQAGSDAGGFDVSLGSFAGDDDRVASAIVGALEQRKVF